VTRIELLNPTELVKPVGFAHGVLVRDARSMLFLAGQCGYGPDGKLLAPDDLVAQFGQALDNMALVLRDAEMEFHNLVQLHLFVRDRDEYHRRRKEFGLVYRRHFGKHYPAMAMFQVVSLYDPAALIELTAVACG
jgi:enamine deaminase RidA (YjgF/YER057c/UK114 family)